MTNLRKANEEYITDLKRRIVWRRKMIARAEQDAKPYHGTEYAGPMQENARGIIASFENAIKLEQAELERLMGVEA